MKTIFLYNKIHAQIHIFFLYLENRIHIYLNVLFILLHNNKERDTEKHKYSELFTINIFIHIHNIILKYLISFNVYNCTSEIVMNI